MQDCYPPSKLANALEKSPSVQLKVPQFVKKFPIFHDIKRFGIAIT
jgi:hypothetical protein